MRVRPKLGGAHSECLAFVASESPAPLSKELSGPSRYTIDLSPQPECSVPVLEPNGTDRELGKLGAKWKGPYRIVAIPVEGAARLEDLEGGESHPDKTGKERDKPTSHKATAEGDADKTEEETTPEPLKIEAVRGERWKEDGRQYLVKWKGKSEAQNTWQYEDNCARCLSLIKEFKAQH
ncbi:hypothetical protein Pelo_3942 [Pelomyxa schiedti]|nr:hypothetical protein Pelo_3942 [Pelomyxa schiedti]